MVGQKIRLTVELGVEDLDCMESILSSGVKVIPDSKDTKKAFATALEHKSYDMCKLLLKCGAVDVVAGDEKGLTPLHHTAQDGELELCQVLIEAGSDVNQKANDDKTALIRAAYSGHEKVVRILIEAGSDLNQKDNNGFTALMVAADNGHEEVVRILIEAGSDVNQKDNNGFTALMVAAQEGHEEIVRILIEAGNDVNQKDNGGSTALILATREGREEVVRILIEAGSDVNQKGNSGYTALMAAAQEGHEEVLRILIEAGSEVNQKDNLIIGGNAIMMSAFYGHAQTSRILLENGADFTAKGTYGETALYLAKEDSKNEETIELLKYVTRLHRSTLFIQSIEYLRNHRQEYEEEEVREYIPDHVMNGFFRNTIWKKEELRRSKRRRK